MGSPTTAIASALPKLVSEIREIRWVVDWHWVVGAGIAVIAAFISNLGLNLQKLSHLENLYENPIERTVRRPKHLQTPMMLRPRWFCGMLCIILGSIADFAALSFAAQSLVATLGSLTLVSNVIIAPILLREEITPSDIRATLLIVTGCTLTVFFGQHESEIYSLQGLMNLYLSRTFAVYAAIVAVVVMCMLAVLWHIERTMRIRNSMASFEYSYLPNSRWHNAHRFLYPAVSGIMGAQSVLLGKSSAELVKTMIAGRGVMFTHAGTYCILGGMFFCIFSQIHWLNAGLQRFDALYLVPVFQTFWVLVSVLGGLVFYHEYANLRPIQMVNFPVGILLTVCGVYKLSQRAGSGGNDPTHGKYLAADALSSEEEEGFLRSDGASLTDAAAGGVNGASGLLHSRHGYRGTAGTGGSNGGGGGGLYSDGFSDSDLASATSLDSDDEAAAAAAAAAVASGAMQPDPRTGATSLMHAAALEAGPTPTPREQWGRMYVQQAEDNASLLPSPSPLLTPAPSFDGTAPSAIEQENAPQELPSFASEWPGYQVASAVASMASEDKREGVVGEEEEDVTVGDCGDIERSFSVQLGAQPPDCHHSSPLYNLPPSVPFDMVDDGATPAVSRDAPSASIPISSAAVSSASIPISNTAVPAEAVPPCAGASLGAVAVADADEVGLEGVSTVSPECKRDTAVTCSPLPAPCPDDDGTVQLAEPEISSSGATQLLPMPESALPLAGSNVVESDGDEQQTGTAARPEEEPLSEGSSAHGETPC